MSTIRLPGLGSRDEVLDWLRRDLRWEIPDDALADDVTFEWTTKELRMSDGHAEHLRGGVVHQIRPLTEGQPWGIFLVEFADDQVHRSALRQVLRGLVPNRRAAAHLHGWHHDNLLFICLSGAGARITFAHFRGDRSSRAHLATFGWERDSGYARTLLEFNLPALRWPKDTGDREAWLRQWSGAFDIEPVSRAFFRLYGEVFERVEAAIAPTLRDKEKRRLFAQRLFNRLMFLAFIEKKGWLTLGQRKDYLNALWDAWTAGASTRGRHSTFFRERLCVLFFNALNNAEPTAKAVAPEAIGSVPYLNGGLFERADDGTDDDSSVVVPDDAIRAILVDLFARFNFTVSESTPLDVEIAVDPEMLGKVFEELVTGRHETGSYYTPKPIVAFMCREALKHHLARACPREEPTAVARFVDEHEPAGLRDGEAVLAALRAVCVCDPACGSGAYLLGMLHELLDLRACLFNTKKLGPASVHDRKLEVIEKNLYGVDIDPFAVNIARLRLWLSLAVEFEGERPPPLPNLEFKIEVGDSLGAPDPHGAFGGQRMLTREPVLQYQAMKAKYLLAHGDEKSRLRGEIDALKRELARWLRWRAPKEAFDWATEFAEVFSREAPTVDAGGFDIILTNPPYVRMELIKPLKPMLRRNFPSVHDERTDLYVYFFARAHELLCAGGIAAFISSNKWLRSGYGEKLRQLLLDAQAFHCVADFGDQPVFQSTAAYPCIFVWQKTPRGGTPTAWAVVKDLAACYAEGVREHLARISEGVPAARFGVGKPRLASATAAERQAKMEASGSRLVDYAHATIGWGVKTGLNEAFLVNRATRDALLAADERSGEVLRHLVAGDDVRRYEIHYRDTYLLYLPHGTEIARYPAVKKHIRPYRAQLEARATKQAWFELQQPQEAYVKFFEQRKIVFPDIAKTTRFAMDEAGFFTSNTTYFIPREDWFLLAVLNSHAVLELMQERNAGIRGGYLRFFGQFLESVPIPDASGGGRETLAAFAREAQRLHGERRARVERFLRDCGLDPAQSSSRNRLEQPWVVEGVDFLRSCARNPSAKPQANLALHKAAREETAAQTEAIEKIEVEIDARVAALYGL